MRQKERRVTESESDTESDRGMVRSDISKPSLFFFSLQEYTQQNPLWKF
jgi:hypothetical protein